MAEHDGDVLLVLVGLTKNNLQETKPLDTKLNAGTGYANNLPKHES